MKKKILGIMLSAIMVLSFALTGCGGGGDKTPAEETPTESEEVSEEPEEKSEEPAEEVSEEPEEQAEESGEEYSGELSLMHFSTSEESQGNGGSDGFRTMIAEWKNENPDITLNESVLANDEFKTQIATLAAAGDLPDVFLLQGMNTKDWANQGLIMDMTDIIKSSPYYADYKSDFFYPFTSDGKIYGLPALTGGTCTVIVYDKQLWADAGYETFPETWDEVLEANAYFEGEGIDTIAFGNSGKWQANSCFLSTVGDRYTGSDWTKSLIEKGGAAFTDQAFVDALTFSQEAFQSGVFNLDFNAVSNEDAREYYISGDAASFLGGNWDVSYIMATLLEVDEDAYNNIGFAVFPQPADATGNTNSQNIGMGYAMSLNSKLADDPAKMAAAIDLCYKLTGPDFATFVAENYALGGLTAVEDVDLSGFDSVTVDFYNWSYEDTNTCEIYDSYITGSVWDTLNTDLQTMLNGDMDPATVAENAQAVYKSDY